jgi:hypothetical protein
MSTTACRVVHPTLHTTPQPSAPPSPARQSPDHYLQPPSIRYQMSTVHYTASPPYRKQGPIHHCTQSIHHPYIYLHTYLTHQPLSRAILYRPVPSRLVSYIHPFPSLTQTTPYPIPSTSLLTPQFPLPPPKSLNKTDHTKRKTPCSCQLDSRQP